MFPLITLIPSIISIFEKFCGSMTSDVKTSFASGLMSKVFNGNFVQEAIELYTGIAGPIEDTKKLALQNALSEYLSDNNLQALSMQLNGQIDLVESQSLTRFNSGWRPFLAWGCSCLLLAFGLMYLINDIFIIILSGGGVAPPVPQFLMVLIGTLLGGYSILRTYEKTQ